MSVKCDVRRHCVKREDQNGLSAIVDESFKRCPEERVSIVQTGQGRVGVCLDHLLEYNRYKLANTGRRTADLQPWARLRRGVIIMGEEVLTS